jgi:hypothetical protein
MRPLAENDKGLNQQQLTKAPPKNKSVGLLVTGSDDPDLAAVIAAWPTLPGDVRRSILQAVKASTGNPRK